MGEEDQWHLMFKFRDGDADSAIELGSSVVSETIYSCTWPASFLISGPCATWSLHYFFCSLVSHVRIIIFGLSVMCSKKGRGQRPACSFVIAVCSKIHLLISPEDVQITLGTIMTSPNRSLECRLKSPEKGKVRILVEPIDADTV